MHITAILQLPDMDFLRALAERYPEMKYLAGAAEASPEGAALLKADALAYQVFGDDCKIDSSAIEADRTFVGLLTLKWSLAGDYDKFIAPQKDPEKRLSRDDFACLSAYARRVAGTDEDIEFCLYSLACNDLGKTLFLVEKHLEITGSAAADHDQLLGTLMVKAPQLFPAFENRLTPVQRKMYAEGIAANLNLGQLVQGENLPANLAGMQAIGAKSRDLRLLCEFFDAAGAAGHIDAGGSIVMNAENYAAFSAAIEELTQLPLQGAYLRYIARRGKMAGIEAEGAEGFARCRIAALSRAFGAEQGAAVTAAWQALEQPLRDVLIRELNATGLPDDSGILIYYAAGFVANSIKSASGYAAGLARALPTLAKVYQDARKNAGGQRGVITVNIAKQARDALSSGGDIFEPAIFPGARLAFIGGGGGSDAVQAAVLAVLTGKPACVLSIRTNKTQSQGSGGSIGEQRTVSDHGGELAPGVFRILPGSSGSGRFLENIPAHLVPVYLVVDSGDGRLRAQMQAALDDFGGVETVVEVDTGGDCLYRSSVSDADIATPDQDLASLKAANGLNAALRLSCVIANGIDSPPYAQEVLSMARARKIDFSAAQKAQILAMYRDFELDGSNPSRYGKTPFAWQAALRGETGRVRIPLPDKVVNDARNPWNPYVNVTADMAGAYVMTMEDHLKAIS